MTEKEKKDFNDLYFYVKQLLKYDDKQVLSRQQVLRLRGICNGKYMANNNTQSYGDVGFDTMLMTLRLYNGEILRGLSRGNFTNEMHKFNYICKIMESHLNDVYLLKQKFMNEDKTIDEIIKNVEFFKPDTTTARGSKEYKNAHKDKEITDEELWGDL